MKGVLIMSVMEVHEHDHKCENCGSLDVKVRNYISIENTETVYHCNTCGYIHWKDQYRG